MRRIYVDVRLTHADRRAHAFDRNAAYCGVDEARVANLRNRPAAVIHECYRRVYHAVRGEIAGNARYLRERPAIETFQRDMIRAGDAAACVHAAEVAAGCERGDAHVPRRS